MKLQFETHGNAKQKECCRAWMDNSVTDIVYGGAKGGAKSYTGAMLIFGDALIYPGTHYFIARKSLNDLRKFTIPTIYEAIAAMGIKTEDYMKYNGQDNYFNLNNGSKVFLLECKYFPSDPYFMRFGSMQMTRGMIEEAGEVSESAKNNLQASIGRWRNKKYKLTGKLLQTCNPSKNYLYKEYYKKWKDGTLESWKRFIQAFPSDNKMLSPEYITNLERSLDGNQKERLLHGNWEYDDDPATLMDFDNIIRIFEDRQIIKGKKYISADIARLGRDKTVIMVWEGLSVIAIKTIEKNKINEAAEVIRRLAKIYGVEMTNVIVDEDGLGGGVKDMLNCKGFVNNSRPLNDENFNNLKSQSYFKLAEQVNAGNVFVRSDDTDLRNAIIEELEQVKKKDIDSDGKQAIIPKDKIKEVIGRSPDYSDCLAMRMWFELKPVWDTFIY